MKICPIQLIIASAYKLHTDFPKKLPQKIRLINFAGR